MNGEFLANAGPLEMVFWFCALFGSTIFLIRLVMMMVGGMDGGEGLDDVGVDGDIPDGDGFESPDAAFQILSIHSIVAFIMMFGWTGLTCYKQYALGAAKSVLLAFLAGFICMLLIAYLFKMARKLVSHGGVFNIKTTIGQKATVYQKIPAQGRGVINYSQAGTNTRELNAVSEYQTEIESFKTVEIVKVIDARTVSVRMIT